MIAMSGGKGEDRRGGRQILDRQARCSRVLLMKIQVAVVILMAGAIPGPLVGQQTGQYWVTGEVGLFHPVDSKLAYRNDAPQYEGDPNWIQSSSSPSVGLRFAYPVSEGLIGLRATVRYAFQSSLVAGTADGTTSCGPSCNAVNYREDDLGTGSLWAFAMGVEVNASPPDWAVRPFVAIGKGLLYHRLDEDRLPSGEAGDEVQGLPLRLQTHWAVGVRVAIGSWTGLLEADVLQGGGGFFSIGLAPPL